MNHQTQEKNSFYMHYKNKIYRLVDTAIDNSGKKASAVIYQPQYGENVLWQRPREMFFEDVDYQGKIVPRFRYLGKTINEVNDVLRKDNIIISPHPVYRTESMLDQKIKELNFGNISIAGLATHSETLGTQIIFRKEGIHSLFTLPADEFFEKFISKN